MISLASLLAALLSLATHNVMAEVAEEEQRMGQDLLDTEMSVIPHPMLQHHPTRHKIIVAN